MEIGIGGRRRGVISTNELVGSRWEKWALAKRLASFLPAGVWDATASTEICSKNKTIYTTSTTSSTVTVTFNYTVSFSVRDLLLLSFMPFFRKLGGLFNHHRRRIPDRKCYRDDGGMAGGWHFRPGQLSESIPTHNTPIFQWAGYLFLLLFSLQT